MLHCGHFLIQGFPLCNQLSIWLCLQALRMDQVGQAGDQKVERVLGAFQQSQALAVGRWRNRESLAFPVEPDPSG